VHLLALQDFDGQLTALLVAEHDDREAAAEAFLVGGQRNVLDIREGDEERADVIGRRLAIQIPDVDLEHAHRDPPGGAAHANERWPVRMLRRTRNVATAQRRSPRGKTKRAPLAFTKRAHEVGDDLLSR
jgi:hypothetical protein